MNRTIPALAALALTLSGCVATRPGGGWGGASERVVERPQTMVAASLQVVRDVIEDSARARGSAVVLVGDGLVLERPLDRSSEDVVQSCGPHRAGRSVRVVLRTRAQGADRTLLSEERYIVDGGATCPLQLTQSDFSQSQQALARIRVQAEAVQARVRTAEAAAR
jgi:hypothetical protein